MTVAGYNAGDRRHRHQPKHLDLGAPGGRRRDPRRPGLAGGRRPVRGRAQTDDCLGARRRGGDHVADHVVLCVAVEPCRGRTRRRCTSAYGGECLLPVPVPQLHASRRGAGRRAPGRAPRACRRRSGAGSAVGRVGASVGAGRAGVADGGRLCFWSRPQALFVSWSPGWSRPSPASRWSSYSCA